jgi:hypothetical protein
MPVSVKLNTCKTITLEVEDTATLEEVKARVSKMKGYEHITPDNMRILFAGSCQVGKLRRKG